MLSATAAAALFGSAPGYLNAAAMGLPTRDTLSAQRADLDAWSQAAVSPAGYEAVVERARAHYAKLVAVALDRVAIASQTSAMVSVLAASLPEGAEVVVPLGEFSSIVFPFYALERRGVRTRSVPLNELADAVTPDTAMVAFSLVQSATGEIAPVERILASASAVGARTVVDTTQAAGVYPVDAARFDATVCHAYKWLCCPRGVAFLTVSEQWQPSIPPIQAGWYAGERIWDSTYGPEQQLAASARVFDVSPAWPAWVGAEPALQMFADLDIADAWRHATTLADCLLERLDRDPQGQAIVTWPDADGADLRALTEAGIAVSGRAGRVRLSCHLWNTPSDVDLAVAALRR